MKSRRPYGGDVAAFISSNSVFGIGIGGGVRVVIVAGVSEGGGCCGVYVKRVVTVA